MSGDTWFKTDLAQTKKTKLAEQFRLFKMKNKGFAKAFIVAYKNGEETEF